MELERKTLHYTSCGHEHILHFSVAENKLNCIRSGGIALAMVEDNSKIIKENRSRRPAIPSSLHGRRHGIDESGGRDVRAGTPQNVRGNAPEPPLREKIRTDLLETLCTFAHGAPGG